MMICWRPQGFNTIMFALIRGVLERHLNKTNKNNFNNTKLWVHIYYKTPYGNYLWWITSSKSDVHHVDVGTTTAAFICEDFPTMSFWNLLAASHIQLNMGYRRVDIGFPFQAYPFKPVHRVQVRASGRPVYVTESRDDFNRKKLPHCLNGEYSAMIFWSILLKQNSSSVLKLTVLKGRLDIIIHHFYVVFKAGCKDVTTIILEDVRSCESCCAHHYSFGNCKRRWCFSLGFSAAQ